MFNNNEVTWRQTCRRSPICSISSLKCSIFLLMVKLGSVELYSWRVPLVKAEIINQDRCYLLPHKGILGSAFPSRAGDLLLLGMWPPEFPDIKSNGSFFITPRISNQRLSPGLNPNVWTQEMWGRCETFYECKKIGLQGHYTVGELCD